jgi:hypothetical protein
VRAPRLSDERPRDVCGTGADERGNAGRRAEGGRRATLVQTHKSPCLLRGDYAVSEPSPHSRRAVERALDVGRGFGGGKEWMRWCGPAICGGVLRGFGGAEDLVGVLSHHLLPRHVALKSMTQPSLLAGTNKRV